MTEPTAALTSCLRDLPSANGFRYGEEARLKLLEQLFTSLACGNDEYLRLLFPDGVPTKSTQDPWILSKAQGAIEGAEYSAAARGKPCGHIFKNGEATYRCKTCSLDETSVLCAKCFESSDHRSHSVFVSISPGNSGCCDCGDPEAWRREIKCAIHTELEPQKMDTDGTEYHSTLPHDLVFAIRATIFKALDYLCDVISCSPEQLRLTKSEKSIRDDELNSRLLGSRYGVGDPSTKDPEFSMLLWNDEKHTVVEVQDQVARACRRPKDWSRKRAEETDVIGRSIVDYDTNVDDLLRKCKIIERIKLTVTIRSARDTFREQMCGTIIEWLVDIAGCTVGSDANMLRHTICEGLLGRWNVGSKAWNTEIGKQGIDDQEHEESEETLRSARNLMISPELRLLRMQQEQLERLQREQEADEEDDDAEERDDDDDNDDGMDVDTGNGAPAPSGGAAAAAAPDGDGDLDMTAGENTSGGPSGAAGQQNGGSSVAEPAPAAVFASKIPLTPAPHHQRKSDTHIPGNHWLEKPEPASSGQPAYEDLRQKVRLDWLIMFDLRMWKKARVDLRELYIGTVVAIPQFKRILGLRFAGLYTTLSQLYLIADREPDHSIINLSLQMLTTPSITAEVVAKGNFLTNLMAILYTFLTTRQVGHPSDVNPEATLAFDAGSLTNRRMYHFFQDMKYLFGSDYVKERLRTSSATMLQFLDLVCLHQGICPNVRAIGNHIEYESDAWICASLITREINKLCRQFAEAFKTPNPHEDPRLYSAIELVARHTIHHSLGLERSRFSAAEIKGDPKFREIKAFGFEQRRGAPEKQYKILQYEVDRQSISFHHAMHYALSWLVEVGKGIPADKLRQLLGFQVSEMGGGPEIQDLTSEDLAIIMFDYPLRVCVWLAQMKANMWVRNGFSLRHQMNTYKGVSQRDLTYHRDIFMLQVAFVIVDPSRMLMTMIDRFGLLQWMNGNYVTPDGFEAAQLWDIIEDFLHLLIVLLTDRLLLIPPEDNQDVTSLQLRREIIHVLCLKPSSFSDLSLRIPERLQDLENFQEVLSEMTNYRPPDGLNDSGMYELKGPYKEEVDPYILHFTKNQREEAETMYKQYMAQKLGKPEEEIVFEPRLPSLKSGAFKHLSQVTSTQLFAQVIYSCLNYATVFQQTNPDAPETRIEAFLHVVLYLIQIAVAEDDNIFQPNAPSFIVNALTLEEPQFGDWTNVEIHDNNIVGVLCKIQAIDAYKTCRPKIEHLLRSMRSKRTALFDQQMASSMALSNLRQEDKEMDLQKQQDEEAARKKAMAKQRQANIMAQFQAQQKTFMDNFALDFEDDDYLDSPPTLAGDEESDAPGEELQPNWDFPKGNCILCQEETNESRVYGTFTMIKNSNIMRQTNLKDPDYLYEVATTPNSLDYSADDIRPFGVARMNRDSLKKMTDDGSEITVVRQGLGKGYPVGDEYVRRGPVAMGCGHLMHFSCFEQYWQATKRRQDHQIARAHPERLDKKEFICPLCRALGNTFLPIIWKPKREHSVSAAMSSKTDFVAWLCSEIAPVISRLEKVADFDDKRAMTKYKEQFQEYGSAAFIEKVALKLNHLPDPGFVHKHMPSETMTSHPAVNFSTTGNFEQQLQMTISLTQGAIASPTGRRQDRPNNELEELDWIYRRLRETLIVNNINSSYPTPEILPNGIRGNQLTNVDTLMKMLGNSIAACEISLRGVASEPGSVFIDKVSEQNLIHLRILSETIQSYICVGGLQDESSTADQYKDIHRQQMQQLFVGHPQIYDDAQKENMKSVEPLLALDIFNFLTECSLCLCPSLNVEFKHILILCYIAEVVKTVIAIGRECGESGKLAFADEERLKAASASARYSDEDISSFLKFVEFVGQSCEPEGSFKAMSSMPAPIFRSLVEKYITPFLRKSVLLLHARYAVVFPETGLDGFEADEPARLLKLLGLPTLESVFAAPLGTDDVAAVVRSIIAGWCGQWAWHIEALRVNGADERFKQALMLSHPSIFELVGLPLHYDTLVEEAMKRRCPNSRRELQDPVVCLFCGDIFCSQSLCCLGPNNQGGANQHMAKCGKDVGLFINIRKCHVLYLQGGLGAWAVAPYLDKHGEVDPNLRRNRQLFLNQKRYDAFLRTVWLQHQIPTVIARKLEPDFNTGGWDSL